MIIYHSSRLCTQHRFELNKSASFSARKLCTVRTHIYTVGCVFLGEDGKLEETALCTIYVQHPAQVLHSLPEDGTLGVWVSTTPRVRVCWEKCVYYNLCRPRYMHATGLERCLLF